MQDEMTELARALASLSDDEYEAVTSAARGGPKGTHVPGLGHQPATLPAVSDIEVLEGQARAARESGDTVTERALRMQVMSLKTAQMFHH